MRIHQGVKCEDPIPTVITCAMCPECGRSAAIEFRAVPHLGGGTMLPTCPTCQVFTKVVQYVQHSNP